jgi:hypothetical protein
MTEEDKVAQQESEARNLWMQADVDKSGPMISGEEVLLQVETLPPAPPSTPSPPSSRWTAERTTTTLTQINDSSPKTRHSSTQVLIAANHLQHDEMTVIDDPRTAVGLLGTSSSAPSAKNCRSSPRAILPCRPSPGPVLDVPVGVARLAELPPNYLEFELIAGRAYTAGLLHDIGKLVLLKLCPSASPRWSTMQGAQTPLHAAERKYVGCTTREIGDASP